MVSRYIDSSQSDDGTLQKEKRWLLAVASRFVSSSYTVPQCSLSILPIVYEKEIRGMQSECGHASRSPAKYTYPRWCFGKRGAMSIVGIVSLYPRRYKVTVHTVHTICKGFPRGSFTGSRAPRPRRRDRRRANKIT